MDNKKQNTTIISVRLNDNQLEQLTFLCESTGLTRTEILLKVLYDA